MSDQETEFQKLLKFGIENKPKDLIIDDLKWKYLVRCVLRGENILMVGPTGCGKCLGPNTKVDVIVSDEIYKVLILWESDKIEDNIARAKKFIENE